MKRRRPSVSPSEGMSTATLTRTRTRTRTLTLTLARTLTRSRTRTRTRTRTCTRTRTLPLQHDVLWPSLTVKEHLELYATLKGVPAAEVGTDVQACLLDVGLADKAHR